MPDVSDHEMRRPGTPIPHVSEYRLPETSADRAARLALRCGELSREVENLRTTVAADLSYQRQLEQVLGELACDCDDYEGWHMTHRLSAAQAKLAKVEALRDELAAVPGSWVGPWVYSLNVFDRLNEILA